MKNNEFYDVLDKDLDKVIQNSIGDEILTKLKQADQKKSYAFLVWFLKFYSNIENVNQYITDGHGDNSCDIILDIMDSQGEKTFYIVQSKWNTLSNCNKEFDGTEMKSFLSDAQCILRGDKEETQNILFNQRYKTLQEHIRSNGNVKVICLSLKNKCSTADKNIESLVKSIGGNISVENLDINQLKKDYIDRYYKKSIPPNPLEKIYSPEYEKITLEILKSEDPNHIKIQSPFEAHVFTIKPSMIFSLVDRYGVSLFDKNVRNPLSKSAINKEITNSLLNDPSFFWYYNNGITAITKAIPAISSQANSFEITGLQIINGAQTAYSIYTAYLNASQEERELIDQEAKITLRLLKSGGKDFDLKVTRFTNSQNPVSERDFWSNDSIQEKIQDYFYDTSLWYERRSGEFRRVPEGVDSVPNYFMAISYLSYYLSDPVSVFDSNIKREHQGQDLIFTSHKENKDGLYEKIFNSETDPIDMHASFCMFDLMNDSLGIGSSNVFYSNGFHVLALSKTITTKYLQMKFDKSINVEKYITDRHEEGTVDKDKIKSLHQCLAFSAKKMKEITVGKVQEENPDAEGKSEAEKDAIIKVMTKRSHFEILHEEVQLLNFTVDDIESMEIDIVESDSLNDSDIDEIEETLH